MYLPEKPDENMKKAPREFTRTDKVNKQHARESL